MSRVERETKELYRRLWSKKTRARVRAVQELKARGEPLFELLVKRLEESSRMVRAYAAHGLGELGDPRAIEPLQRALTDRSLRVRARVVVALGALQGVHALAMLARELHAASPLVRAGAVKALNALGDTTTLPRKVLAAPGLTAPERCELLETLRRITYWRGIRRIRFNLPPTPAYCERLLKDSEASVAAGARAIRDYLTLGRAVERAPDTESERLLRPAEGVHEAVDTSRLLRAAEAPPEASAEAPRRAGWWVSLRAWLRR